jgi:hypothetical protein
MMAHPTLTQLVSSIGVERPTVLKTLFAPDFKNVNKCLLQLYRASMSATGVDYGFHTLTTYIITFISHDTATRFHFAVDQSHIINMYQPIKETTNMKQHLDPTSLYLHNMIGALAHRIGEHESYLDLVTGELTHRVAEDHLVDLLTVRHCGTDRLILQYSLDAINTYATYTCVHNSSHPDDWLIEDCVIVGERLSSDDTLYDADPADVLEMT